MNGTDPHWEFDATFVPKVMIAVSAVKSQGRKGHKRCKQVLTEGEPYEIIRKAPRAAPAEGAAQQDLKRSDSHWSLRRGRSMRLQQWGSWIAYEDPNLYTLFWCD